MCDFIIDTHVAMGYGCCRCQVYNGFQREQCKNCGIAHCDPFIVPENQTALYEEDGGSTKVRVLSAKADASGVGLELEAISSERDSPLVGGIPAGHKWTPWKSHSAAGYGGGMIWSLKGATT